MKICKYCGKELDEKALFCGFCGKQCEDLPQDMVVCSQCGRQNQVGDVFCQECGAELKSRGRAEEEPAREEPEGKSCAAKEKRKIFVPAAGGILVAAIAAGSLFLTSKALKNKGDAGVFGIQAELQEEALFDLSQAELVENYRKPEGAGTIDLVAGNHQPGARDTSALWDKELFYRLEDLGGEDDNHIADCLLARMELVRTDNGKTVEYEVYRDQETGQVVKIVSIEAMEDQSLEISDYYYQDGKPNFVFRRSDSIYTPSYATIDKTGERYYFAGDQMVKWRWIYEPSVVKQWILEPEDTWYTQWGYGEISDGERGQYDEKEYQVLNEAYNTYEAVLANEPAALIKGRVTDEEGRPLPSVEVGIGRMENGEARPPEVKVETDGEGMYAWELPEGEEGGEYFLVFRKEGWIPCLMQVPDMAGKAGMAESVQEDMALLKEREEDGCPVTFYAYQVQAQDEEDVLKRAFSEGEEEERLPALAGASVKVYRGVNWLTGSPAAEGETLEDGSLSVEVPAGIYTAVIEKEGIVPSRKVFLAGGREEIQTVYAMAEGDGEPSGSGEGWSILLSWDSSETEPLDLDSSLFTPDKAAKGDRNCINALNRTDNGGARLLYDGEGRNACELITLTTPKRGSYKYYVTDYTGIQSGAMDSRRMAESGAKVTVFYNGVPVKTFAAPDKAGTVWEVFELRDQGIVPIQEVYGSAEGKSWWTEDKRLFMLSERSIKAEWIQSDGEWLYFSNPADEGKLYYCRKDGSGLTKFSEDVLADERILLVGDQIYYVTYNSGAAEYGYMSQNIVRVKNDGSGRAVIQEDIRLAEIEVCDGVYLMGYADGMIYYFNSSEISRVGSAVPAEGGSADTSLWSVTAGNENGAYSHGGYGGKPGMTAVVGRFLYYMDEIDYGKYSFCRKDLESGEEECLAPQVNWHPWTWRIYKGWIYFTEHGAIKRTRLMGPGSLTEQEVLAENGVDCESLYGIGNEDTYYWLRFSGDTCYYQGNDKQVYAMNLDGSGQRALGLAGSMAVAVDGEMYVTDPGYGLRSVTVSDINGENQRKLFDAAPMWNDKAGKAYAQFLESYVPEVLDLEGERQDYNQWPYFACQDIDGDGVNELFVSYGYYRDSYLDYYRYDGRWMKTIWKGQCGTSDVYINEGAQEIVVYEHVIGYSFDAVVRYGVDGSVIHRTECSGITNINYESEEAAVEAAYETYAKPYPRLEFVDNTPENRQKYLLGGAETGWASQ